MYIKQVNQETKDVFMGKGWDQWVRYTYRDGKWVKCGGVRIDTDTHRKITERLNQPKGVRHA